MAFLSFLWTKSQNAPLIQTEFKIKKERKNMEKHFSGGTKAIIRMQSMYQLYFCSSQYKDTTKRI